MMSLEDASRSLLGSENRSTTKDGSVDPIGLIVIIAPKRVNATSDFDQRGLPEPTDTE